jgi:hypothetical protein
METIQKNCGLCDKVFDAKLKEHDRGNAKYCSLSCSSKSKSKRKELKPNLVCLYCNKSFYRCESKKLRSKSGLFFCCREHKDLAQKIENGFLEVQPSHYGTGIGSHNYREKAFKAKGKKCEKCGYSEHIEILQVHHKDRNRKNNELLNLEVLCPNCHMWTHYENKDGCYKKNFKLGT